MAYQIDPDIIVNSVVTSMTSGFMSSLTDKLWAKFLAQFPVVSAKTHGMDCDTMCTDGIYIYYSPDFVRNICLDAMEQKQDKLAEERIKFVLAHELMHIIDRNTAKKREDVVFKIPGPADNAYAVLHDMSNKAQDAVINARLKREFNDGFLPGWSERDEEGNVVKLYKLCLYEGKEEMLWTELFVDACNESVKKISEMMNLDIKSFPDNFFEAIKLFREVFSKLPKDVQQQLADMSQSSQSQSEQSQSEQSQSEQSQSGQSQSEQSQDQSRSQEKGSKKSGNDELAEIIAKAIKDALGGDAALDDHEKNEELFSKGKNHISQTKLDRAMNEIRAEINRSGHKGIGTGAGKTSILISMCERYFRPKPEPWYVGISMLMKSKVQEGRQVRERIPPLEMLSQAMSGVSIVHFDKQCKQLNLAFAVDVSGSMDNEEVLSGVLKILEYIEREIPAGSHGHRFIFCQVDAGVEEWKDMKIPSYEYTEWKDDLAESGFVRKGYGGTEFAPFFKKLNEERVRPDAVVVFSDMGLYDFDVVEKEIEMYNQNVIWLCCSERIPDEFYKYELGRVYETRSLFDEIREEQEMSR